MVSVFVFFARSSSLSLILHSSYASISISLFALHLDRMFVLVSTHFTFIGAFSTLFFFLFSSSSSYLVIFVLVLLLLLTLGLLMLHFSLSCFTL